MLVKVEVYINIIDFNKFLSMDHENHVMFLSNDADQEVVIAKMGRFDGPYIVEK